MLAVLHGAGKTVVLAPERRRATRREYARDPYAAHHLIEHPFGTLQQCRASATRHRTTRSSLLAAVHRIASALLLN